MGVVVDDHRELKGLEFRVVVGLGVHQGEFVELGREVRDELLGGDAAVADQGQVVRALDLVDLRDGRGVHPPGHDPFEGQRRAQRVRVGVDDDQPVVFFLEQAEQLIDLIVKLSEECHVLSLFQG